MWHYKEESDIHLWLSEAEQQLHPMASWEKSGWGDQRGKRRHFNGMKQLKSVLVLNLQTLLQCTWSLKVVCPVLFLPFSPSVQTPPFRPLQGQSFLHEWQLDDALKLLLLPLPSELGLLLLPSWDLHGDAELFIIAAGVRLLLCGGGAEAGWRAGLVLRAPRVWNSAGES